MLAIIGLIVLVIICLKCIIGGFIGTVFIRGNDGDATGAIILMLLGIAGLIFLCIKYVHINIG